MVVQEPWLTIPMDQKFKNYTVGTSIQQPRVQEDKDPVGANQWLNAQGLYLSRPGLQVHKDNITTTHGFRRKKEYTLAKQGFRCVNMYYACLNKKKVQMRKNHILAYHRSPGTRSILIMASRAPNTRIVFGANQVFSCCCIRGRNSEHAVLNNRTVLAQSKSLLVEIQDKL